MVDVAGLIAAATDTVMTEGHAYCPAPERAKTSPKDPMPDGAGMAPGMYGIPGEPHDARAT
jgi:hypothetical protein